MKICAVSEAQFVCNITLQDIHTPAMFVDVHTFALYLLLASMHSCLKKVAAHTRLLWVLQMVDQLSILLTYPLHHTKNVFLPASGRMGEIASNKYHEVFEFLDDCTSTLHKFKCGTGTIPSCSILQDDETMGQPGPSLTRLPEQPAPTSPEEASSLPTPSTSTPAKLPIPPSLPTTFQGPSSTWAPK